MNKLENPKRMIARYVLLVVVSFVLSGCYDVPVYISRGLPTGQVRVGESIPIRVRVGLDNPYWSALSFLDSDNNWMDIGECSREWFASGNEDFWEKNCELVFDTPGLYTFRVVYGAGVIRWFFSQDHEAISAISYTFEVLEAPPKTSTWVEALEVSWYDKENGGPLVAGMTAAFSISEVVLGSSRNAENVEPTGEIVIGVGGTSCEINIVDLQDCDLVIPDFPLGVPDEQEVTVEYSGDYLYDGFDFVDTIVIEHVVPDMRGFTLPQTSSLGEAVSLNVEIPGVEIPGTNDVRLAAGEVVFNIHEVNSIIECTADLVPQIDSGMSTATCDTTWTPSGVGDFVIDVDYAGDAFYEGVAVNMTHTVGLLSTITTIPWTFPSGGGGAVTIVKGTLVTFGVKVTGDGVQVPTGTVMVSGGGGSCTANLDANGDGGCLITMNTSGTFTITAEYGGDSLNAPSSGSITYTIVEPTLIPTLIPTLTPTSQPTLTPTKTPIP